MAGDRGANVFERLVVDLPEQIHVDIVGLKGAGVLREADRLQPVADRVHRLELLQQRLGRDEIGGVEAFGEPSVDGYEKGARFLAPALTCQKPSEARRRPQLPRFRLLPAGDRDRLAERGFRRPLRRTPRRR